MTRDVRLLPVASREALLEFVEDIKNYPDTKAREEFVSLFGGAFENWYFQEIDGRCYVVAVTEGDGDAIQNAFAQYRGLDQPFFNWFNDRIDKITGISMRETPGGNSSEHVFEFGR